MRTILVENESHSLNLLKSLLASDAREIKIVGEAKTVEEATMLITKEKPDLLFLDVELNDGNGFDVLKRFDKPSFKVVFVTGYDQYAIQAIKQAAFDYLLKPLVPSELKDTVKRLLKEFNTCDLSSDCDKTILLVDGRKFRISNYDDIMCITSFKPYSKIHFSDGSSLLSSDALNSFPTRLPNYFFRVHRSYIINLKQVQFADLKKLEIKLQSGQGIPLAHRRSSEFIRELKRYREDLLP